jgi:hypothetical protein
MGMVPFMASAGFFSNVIPAKAGIQGCETRRSPLDSRFRGNDDGGLPAKVEASAPHPNP